MSSQTSPAETGGNEVFIVYKPEQAGLVDGKDGLATRTRAEIERFCEAKVGSGEGPWLLDPGNFAKTKDSIERKNLRWKTVSGAA